MPKKTVEPVAVKHHGKSRWRVIVPRELNDGKRRVRFFRTKGDAEAFAGDLNRQRGGSVGIILAQPANVQESIVRALRTLGEAFSPRMDEAAALFIKHVMAQPRAARSVERTIAECLESKEAAGRRSRYVSQLKHSLNRFKLAFGLRLIHELTPADIERWLNTNAWGAATRRSYLTDVRTLFSFAINRGYCTENMAARVERPDYEDKAPPILTVQQTHSLLKSAMENDPPLVAYLALCLFAGIRPAEAGQLEWSDILNGYVQVQGHKAKTRRRRLVTMNPALKEWLAVGAIALRGELPPVNLRKRVEHVRRMAKIPWGHDCMRHSFASYHVALHGSAEKTALEMGHSGTATLFAHYRELVTKEDAQKFFSTTPNTITA